MAIRGLFSGDMGRQSTLYLAIGGLSLVKAIAVRRDPDRFRRELLDAGLFIGVGLVLRRFARMKTQKREAMTDRIPDWIAGEPAPSEQSRTGLGLRSRAKRRLGQEPTEQASLGDRAMRAVTSW